ncbi:MAG: hypothetical protein J6W38_04710, partial [Prevotella sp.]|nr:hypothetical protein [Prevotella sp.]
MGNLGEKFGLMLRNLGTKIANNFGTAADTYVPICNGTSGAANTQLTPKGAMNLIELASVLGDRMDHLPVLQEILYLRATSRDGDISKASVKIPGEKRGLRQAIFIV